MYSKLALKDAKKLEMSHLKEKAQKILDIIAQNPHQTPPPYEKLIGKLANSYSRRINIQHRIVYTILEAEKTIKIIRMWTHYE